MQGVIIAGEDSSQVQELLLWMWFLCQWVWKLLVRRRGLDNLVVDICMQDFKRENRGKGLSEQPCANDVD